MSRILRGYDAHTPQVFAVVTSNLRSLLLYGNYQSITFPAFTHTMTVRSKIKAQ